MKKLTLILFALILLNACGIKNSNEGKSVIAHPDKTKIEDSGTPQTKSLANHPGKKVYDSACLACHMGDGSGVPGMHPPLMKSDFVNGDPDKLITIILKGLSGKVEVNGEIYNSIMPPQTNLTDNQIADVLTFIRASFGNNSEEISLEQVQKVRNK